MRFFIVWLALAGTCQAAPTLVGSTTPLPPLASGMKNPESVCIGPDGRIYVTCIGEFDAKGDGKVVVIVDGKPVDFCTGLDDPKGIVTFQNGFFVADRDKVLRIDAKGKATVFADTKAFPTLPQFLNDVEVDPQGNVYVSDSGDLKGKGGKLFKISPRGKVTLLADSTTHAGFQSTNGLRRTSEYHLLVLDFYSNDLLRVRTSDGQTEKVYSGVAKADDGIAIDHFGRTYLTSWKEGTLWLLEKPTARPRLYAQGFEQAADCCLSADGKSILVPDMKAGTLTAVPILSTGDTKLEAKIVPAFDEIQWEGFTPAPEKGAQTEFRPLVVTHAGDGSGRTFVLEQRGTVYVIPKGMTRGVAKAFLNLRDRVKYTVNENEEGLLGIAFPPDFKETGVFYVYYTPKRRPGEKMTNRLSRFKVSKEDANRAEPASEEILLTFDKPFWNHDGGTLAFGPDGMLYIAVGDGGAANDPYGHAQNLNSLLGKILRLDVRGTKGYAIPKDNPFVGKDKARGEIWAYGFRNVWRMSFDRVTGTLWAADVGQNLWEEINLVERGGNYGWRNREGQHPFGQNGQDAQAKEMIEPIWEYHHDLGKSITGGHVYRGKAVPALVGKYLYADYVSGDVWALDYDAKQRRVVANHTLRKGGFAVMSFGEDEDGEVYLLTMSGDGKGIYKFAR
ncbi:MAG: PQQ-dependent sugar dehydrogenase [Gemmataceae bacterium]